MMVNSFAHTICTKPVGHYTRQDFTDNGSMASDTGKHLHRENDFIDLGRRGTILSTTLASHAVLKLYFHVS
ncbi:hypothetical protein IHE45_04G177300 [Dioscorea alata]|uniref:Uncharacterized protein n=1 Tax=Dioscorea alata TaxID=55571 RepID=A0ACB7WIL7_DIOAL|nr:hypothetical protein IHE45_04G177300 [Dioscorea alata]